jgi:hypothetical protein
VPRRCGACGSADRESIDAAIVRGDSNRSIATRFSLQASAISRHKRHIAGDLERNRSRIGIDRAATVVAILAEAQAVVDRARKANGKRDGQLLDGLRTMIGALRYLPEPVGTTEAWNAKSPEEQLLAIDRIRAQLAQLEAAARGKLLREGGAGRQSNG